MDLFVICFEKDIINKQNDWMIFNKELYSTPTLKSTKTKCMNTEIVYKIAQKSKQF